MNAKTIPAADFESATVKLRELSIDPAKWLPPQLRTEGYAGPKAKATKAKAKKRR